jgi:hypothetical protein
MTRAQRPCTWHARRRRLHVEGEEMASVKDILERFRPAGAPGALAAVGVPSDRSAAIAAELAPLFDALASAAATSIELRRVGAAFASAALAQATRDADALVAAAARTASEDRDNACRAAERAAEPEFAAIERSATREAMDVRTRADESRAALVERALDLASRQIYGQGATAASGRVRRS